MEVSEIEELVANELKLVGELFSQLFEKYSRMENKKHLYKDLKDLTIIEINTIIVIGSEEMKSMSRIAQNLGVSFGTPTVTIDRLISKGYVERIRDEEDRRQVFVKLSDKGVKVYKCIIDLKRKFAEKLFGILEEEERRGLISVLSRLNNTFDDIFKSLF